MNMETRLGAAREASRDERPAELIERPRWHRYALYVAPVVLLAGGYGLVHRSSPAVVAPPPPTVSAAAPLQRDVNEWDDYVGRFEASKSVEVRPRVSGAVTAVHFTDGAIVRQGQLLFTIDPRPFTVALAEAKAGVASAASDLALAQADLDRAHRLQADDAVSKSDVDRLTARVRATQAALAAAQARVGARALDVQFTQVRAPLTGRISDRKVDPGNLVTTGDTGGGTLLTTINALDPIYFNFDSSEALFLKNQRVRTRVGSPIEAVQIRLQDEGDYRWQGRVDFTDNGISATSGTIRTRAVVSNPRYFLAPGMFGNMRLSNGGTTHALLVPDGAVRTDQARKVVYVVGKDGVVAARGVTPGPLVGGLRSIRSGLSASDRVIVQGMQAAPPGTKVSVRTTRITPPAGSVKLAPSAAEPAASQATLAAT